MKLIIVLGILELVSAEYISSVSCPKRPIHQDFDIKRISGRWYTVMQYTDGYTSSMTCGYGDYQKIDDYGVKVTDCELSGGKYTCLTGIITVDDPTRSPLEGRTSYAYIEDPLTKVDQFKYLSVDYDNYAIVYECKDQPNGSSMHSLWVSSRTPVMSETARSNVNKFIDKHFDRNELKQIQQDPKICGNRE